MKWLFVHIREPENIERFVSSMKAIANYMVMDAYDEEGKLRKDDRLFFDVKSVLVTSDMTENHEYGNHADDDVSKYDYDYTYQNNRIDVGNVKINADNFDIKPFYSMIVEGMEL